jgi:hypothetical protein
VSHLTRNQLDSFRSIKTLSLFRPAITSPKQQAACLISCMLHYLSKVAKWMGQADCWMIMCLLSKALWSVLYRSELAYIRHFKNRVQPQSLCFVQAAMEGGLHLMSSRSRRLQRCCIKTEVA